MAPSGGARLPGSQTASDTPHHQVSSNKSSKSLNEIAREQNESARKAARSFAKKVEAIAKCNEDLISRIETDYVPRTEHDGLKKQLENAPQISKEEHDELKTTLEQAQEQAKNLKFSNDEREVQFRLELEKVAAENRSLSTLVGELHNQLKDAKAAKKQALAKLKSIFMEIGDSDDEQVSEIISLTTRPKDMDQDHHMEDITLVAEGDADQDRDTETNTSLCPARPPALKKKNRMITFHYSSNQHLQDAINGRDWPGRTQTPEADTRTAIPAPGKESFLSQQAESSQQASEPIDPAKLKDVPSPHKITATADTTSPNTAFVQGVLCTMVEPHAQSIPNKSRMTTLVPREDPQDEEMCEADATEETARRSKDAAVQSLSSATRTLALSIPSGSWTSDVTVTKGTAGLFGGRYGTPPDADSVFGQYNPVTKTFGSRLSLSKSRDNSFVQSPHRSSSPFPRPSYSPPTPIQVNIVSPMILPADDSAGLFLVSDDDVDVPQEYKPSTRPLSTKEHLQDRMMENARSHEQEIQRRRTKADLEKQLAKQSSAQAARAAAGFSQSPNFIPFDSPSTRAQTQTSIVPPMARIQSPLDEHDHGLQPAISSPVLEQEAFFQRAPGTTQEPIDLDTATATTHEQVNPQAAMQDATNPADHNRCRAPSPPRSTKVTRRQARPQRSNAASQSSAGKKTQGTSNERHTRSPSLEVVSDRQIVPKVKFTAATAVHSPSKTIIKNEPRTQTPRILKDTNLNSESSPLKRRYDATYDPRSKSQAHVEDKDSVRSPKRLCAPSTESQTEAVFPPRFALGIDNACRPYAPGYPPSSANWSFARWYGKP